MLELEVGKRQNLCARCQSFDNIECPSGNDTWREVIHILRTSLREDCISCESLSHYFQDSNSIHIHLYLYADYYHIRNEATLIYFEVWKSDNSFQSYHLIPEEYLSPRPNWKRKDDLVVDLASADLARAKKWIDNCRTSHSSDGECFAMSCTVSPVEMKIPLRIIDCKTLDVRPLLPNESYACLSYVWGSKSPAKAPVGSQLDLATVPKTISDAIFVAEKLGIPRLWVDQYCIDQEDKNARHESIASMHLIYGGAEVTIVAAAGTDASHGLPGILGTERMHQALRFVTLGRWNFVQYLATSQQVRSAIWNSRGWTFQEALLSLRLLVFTETQMYFQCAKMHCFEYFMDERENSDCLKQRQVFPTRGIGTSAFDVFERICEYFPRELSFATDILKAVEGILEAFGGAQMGAMRVRHFYGTPVLYDINDSSGQDFDVAQGLTWQILNKGLDDEPKKYGDSFESGLPSWTWASQKLARFSSGRELRFGCGNPYYESAQAIECHITDRNGETIDIFQYAIFGSKHYSDYHPWIDVTAWTIQGYITRRESEGIIGFTFSGLEKADLFFDNADVADDISRGSQEITAIFLDGHYEYPKGNLAPLYFLLIRPATSGMFSRVGLLLLYTIFMEHVPREIIEDPLSFLQSHGLNNDATVERKTVRIV